MSGGGRSSREMKTNRSSHEMKTNQSETGITIATSPHSDAENSTQVPSSSGRGSILSAKSMSRLGDTKPSPCPETRAASDCKNCSGYIDDCNRNMLKFVTSSKMLDFIFESDNLCDKSEECLKLEREADGWSNFADKTVGAVKSAVSIAVGFLLGGGKKIRPCPESDGSSNGEHSDGNCSDDYNSDVDNQGQRPDSGPHSNLKRCSSQGNLPTGTRSNIGLGTNCSTVRIVHENGESVTNSQADLICDYHMTQLELLTRLERISNLCKVPFDENLLGESAPSPMPAPCRSRSVHYFGPTPAGTSPSEGVGGGPQKSPSYTIMQELQPSNEASLPPSCSPSQQTQFDPELGRPPQEDKSNDAPPQPDTFDVGIQNGPMTSSECEPSPIDEPEMPPQDNKSTNTTNDVGTQPCEPEVLPPLGPDPCTSSADVGTIPKLQDQTTQQVPKENEKGRHQAALKCVITEVTHGAETETTVEINGQAIKMPTDHNTKDLWTHDLQKLNDTGSALKHNLEEVKNIKDKSAGHGHKSNRMRDLQKTTTENITSINVTEEEDFFPENEKDRKNKVKNTSVNVHDFHHSDGQPSVKGLEVEGQLLDPDEEPELETYIKRLEEIEATLEEIALDFKDMMKDPEAPSDKNKDKDKEQDNNEDKEKNKEQPPQPSSSPINKRDSGGNPRGSSDKNKDQRLSNPIVKRKDGSSGSKGAKK